jgi:YesN/AraC family two-component response regulator
MRVPISIEKVQPFVRFSQLFHAGHWPALAAYDYRLFYVMSGGGDFICGDAIYSIDTDCLIIIPPALAYQFKLNGYKEMELIGINFDYSQNCSANSIPIAPDTQKNFKPENITEIVEFKDAKPLNSLVLIRNIIDVKHEIMEIYNEYHYQRKFFRERIRGYMTSVIVRAARNLSNIESEESHSQNIIDEIILYIRQNYNKDLTNKKIGKKFNLHPNYINKLMVENMGTSLYQYLLQIRISEAINLLQLGEMTVKQVALAVGFTDTGHFTKYFKKKTGKTPSEYRNKSN